MTFPIRMLAWLWLIAARFLLEAGGHRRLDAQHDPVLERSSLLPALGTGNGLRNENVPLVQVTAHVRVTAGSLNHTVEIYFSTGDLIPEENWLSASIGQKHHWSAGVRAAHMSFCQSF